MNGTAAEVPPPAFTTTGRTLARAPPAGTATAACSSVGEAERTRAGSPPIVTSLPAGVGSNPRPLMVTRWPTGPVAGVTSATSGRWPRKSVTGRAVSPLASSVKGTPCPSVNGTSGTSTATASAPRRPASLISARWPAILTATPVPPRFFPTITTSPPGSATSGSRRVTRGSRTTFRKSAFEAAPPRSTTTCRSTGPLAARSAGKVTTICVSVALTTVP